MDRAELLREMAEERLLEQGEARRFLYRDVEQLIRNGYLYHSFQIGDTYYTFRSLNPLEFEAAARRPYFRAHCLGISLCEIDGFPIPEELKHHVALTFLHLPLKFVDELFKAVIVAFKFRIDRAYRLVESYCYEDFGRSTWQNLGKPFDPGHLKSANRIFRWWCVYNMNTDRVEEDERQWSHTRMVVSAMATKGAKKLYDDADRERERRDERKRRKIEETVNWIIRGDEPKEKVFIEVNGEKVEVQNMNFAQTFGDLTDEMNRVFSGDKDYHDLLVDNYYQRIREGVEKKKRKAQKERSKREAELPVSQKALVGYSPQQLSELRPELAKRRTTTRTSSNPEFDAVYSRYIENEIKPGVLGPDMKVMISDREPSGEGSEAKGGSLQDKITNRKPSLEG